MAYKIYAIRCRENGKMYIGRTGEASLEERYKKHRYKLNKGICSSKTMQKDWDRYSQSSFGITQLFETDDYEYSKRLEKLVSLTLGTNNGSYGYNRQDPIYTKWPTVLYERRKISEAEIFLKRRVLAVISGDINELADKAGYSQETIESWREDPLSIRAVDLIRLENVTGVR